MRKTITDSSSLTRDNNAAGLAPANLAGMAFSLAVVGGIVAVVAAGYILRPHILTIGIYSLSIYGIFTVSHFVGQIIFASMNRKRWVEKPPKGLTSNYKPTVSVVVPTYHEDPDLLRACLESIAGQNYENIVQVILSNDGGDPSAAEIFDQVSRKAKIGGQIYLPEGWIYLSNEHRGKGGRCIAPSMWQRGR